MKGKGVFRGMIAAIAGFLGGLKFGRNKDKHYADPLMRDPYVRMRSRGGTKRDSHKRGTKRLKNPPFKPGTVTYHDWLVRELGYDRRLADGYEYAFLNGYKIKMPMPSDLSV